VKDGSAPTGGWRATEALTEFKQVPLRCHPGYAPDVENRTDARQLPAVHSLADTEFQEMPVKSDDATGPGSQVDRVFDMYNTLDFSDLESTLTPDFQRTAPGMSVSSAAGMVDLLKGLRQACPDLRLEGHQRSFARISRSFTGR
jgi:hypothetical protein